MSVQFDPAFKARPTQDELREMERDLRFYPSTVDDPSTLTAGQVAAFNRDGYLKGFRIFDAAGIAGHRAFFDEQLRKVQAAGHGSFSISSAHLKYSKVYDLMLHPGILAYVHDLLGPEPRRPGLALLLQAAQGRHHRLLAPGRQLLAADPVEDGHRLAGHRRRQYRQWLHALRSGFAPPRPARIPPQRRLGKQRLDQTVDDVERYGEIVDVELEAGEISIHSDLLLHSSHYNESDRRRCGLTLRYCTPDVRAVPGYAWEKEGVLINASDPSGHWGNPPRPERDYEAA